MTHKIEDPGELIAQYGADAVVGFANGFTTTLSQALEAERMLCPADTEQRHDPVKRLGYLASMLAAGESLLPEHQYLVPKPE